MSVLFNTFILQEAVYLCSGSNVNKLSNEIKRNGRITPSQLNIDGDLIYHLLYFDGSD